MGRPPLFTDPEEMQIKIDLYFTQEQAPTITGLCLFLGFESRQSFYRYEDVEGFSYTIKRARSRMEHYYEKALMRDGQVTGPIFALKNLGWKDKQEIETTGTTTQLLKFVDDDRDAEID